MAEPDRIRTLLKDKPSGLSIEEISKTLSINRITAAKYLNAMLSAGVVQKRVCGPAKLFSLTQRIPVGNLVNILANPAFLVDHDFFVRQVNDQFLNVFSIQKELFLNTNFEYSPFVQFFSQADIQSISVALISGREHHFSISISLQGKLLYFQVQIIPVTFEAGEIGALVTLEDITELVSYQENLEQMVDQRTKELEKVNQKLFQEVEFQRRLRKQLNETQKQYSELVENAQNIILKLDDKQRIRFSNDFAQIFFKIPVKSYISQPFIGTIIPEDTALASLFSSLFDSLAINPSESQTIQTEIDGSYGNRWIIWNIRAIFKGKRRKMTFILVGTDVTSSVQAKMKVEESERILADILTHLPDPTFVLNQERRIIFWNTAMERMTGIKSEDIVGKGRETYPVSIYEYKRPVLADLIFEPDNPEILSYFKNIRTEDGAIVAETSATKPNGETRKYWVKVTAFSNSSGEVIGAIQSMRDITEYFSTWTKGILNSPECKKPPGT